MLLIQAVAVSLVVLYYQDLTFQLWADQLQVVKLRGGLPFSALATAISGTVVPELARWLTRRPRTPVDKLAFQFGFFAFLGVTIDLLYRFLAVLFGTSASFQIVLTKVVFDQAIYSPACSMVLSTVAFVWEDQGFSFSKTSAALRHGGFGRRYAALLVTCWCFWIPVLAAVYTLPANLQFMLFLCANGAWSLLLVFLSSETTSGQERLA